MGYRMAVNLRQNMPRHAALYVFDLDDHTCQSFALQYNYHGPIIVAKSSKDVASNCQILLSIVPTHDEVAQVYLDPVDGIMAAHEHPDRLMLECSTINIKATREIGGKIIESGKGIYVDSPVLGSIRSAEEGSIAFLVGHPNSETHPIVKRIKDVFSYLGPLGQVKLCGPLGSGLACKLVSNYVSVNNILSIVEGMSFGLRYGVDKTTLHQLVKTSSNKYQTADNKKGVKKEFEQAPTAEDMPTTFPTRLVMDDLAMSISAAREVGVYASMGVAALKTFGRVNENSKVKSKDANSICEEYNQD